MEISLDLKHTSKQKAFYLKSYQACNEENETDV